MSSNKPNMRAKTTWFGARAVWHWCRIWHQWCSRQQKENQKHGTCRTMAWERGHHTIETAQTRLWAKNKIIAKTETRINHMKAAKAAVSEERQIEAATTSGNSSARSSPGCFACGEIGHLARKCPNTHRTAPQNQQQDRTHINDRYKHNNNYYKLNFDSSNQNASSHGNIDQTGSSRPNISRESANLLDLGPWACNSKCTPQ